MNEIDYVRGYDSAIRMMIDKLLSHLPAQARREAVQSMFEHDLREKLRNLCEEMELDNTWTDERYLVDVVEDITEELVARKKETKS